MLMFIATNSTINNSARNATAHQHRMNLAAFTSAGDTDKEWINTAYRIARLCHAIVVGFNARRVDPQVVDVLGTEFLHQIGVVGADRNRNVLQAFRSLLGGYDNLFNSLGQGSTGNCRGDWVSDRHILEFGQPWTRLQRGQVGRFRCPCA